MALELDTLLAAIPGDNPAGRDVSYDDVYDKIKEARRQDDPNLAQGDWQAELKVAQWPIVRDLAQQVLTEQSKDLQVSAWLAEAAVRMKGFEGLADGLTLLERLLAEYWDTLFPAIDGDDLDERAGKIAWLEKTLPLIVQGIPLTQEGSYGWFRWKESRDVDNLARTNPALRTEALANGKISAEMWDKAVIGTPAEFYAPLLPQIEACQVSVGALIKRVDEKFGREAPGLGQLRQSIADCAELILRIARDKGLIGAEEEAAEEGGEAVAGGGGGGGRGGPGGPLQSRAEALRRLGEVSDYFRRTEPHSPVAYLVDRAVRWGNMSLDQWLEEMIKDSGTLEGLRETLGILPPPE